MTEDNVKLQSRHDLLLKNERLRSENDRLSRENAGLREELDFLKTYPSIALGLKGEVIVAGLTGGVLTGFIDPYDVVIKTGDRIEVKMSSLHRKVNPQSINRRWIWSSALGRRERKTYEFLVLIGEKDPRYLEQYPRDLPFVFFLVPRSEVPLIRNKGMVALTTNLPGARKPAAQVLKRHMVRSGATFNDLLAHSVAP